MANQVMPAPDTVLVEFDEQAALDATQADEQQEAGFDKPLPFKWSNALPATVLAIGDASPNAIQLDAQEGDGVLLDPSSAINGLRVAPGVFLLSTYAVKAVVKTAADE